MARTATLVALVAGLAAAGWVVALAGTGGGMMADEALGLGAARWFVVSWVAMTAAMMLPSALPVLLAVDRISRRAAPFALGYVVAWTAWGLVVYGAALVGARAGLHGSRWLTAGALVVAALYQLAPAKDACLRRCRAPLAVALAQRQGGRLHVLRGGIVYGALCVGCCAGLMLALLVLGMASVLWLLVAATAIAAEKLLPHGERLVWPFGLLLLVLAGAGL